MAKRTNIAHLIEDLHDASPAGFAVALHITFATPTYLVQAYPKDWMALYSERGLHMQDPTVVWGFGNTGSIRWSELAPEDSAGIFAMAAGYGLTHGVTVAVVEDGVRSVASFARSDREFTDGEMATLHRNVTLLHGETAGTTGLSDADRAALRAMSVRLTHP